MCLPVYSKSGNVKTTDNSKLKLSVAVLQYSSPSNEVSVAVLQYSSPSNEVSVAVLQYSSPSNELSVAV